MSVLNKARRNVDVFCVSTKMSEVMCQHRIIVCYISF